MLTEIEVLAVVEVVVLEATALAAVVSVVVECRESCILHHKLYFLLLAFSRYNCMIEPNTILAVYTGEWLLRTPILSVVSV